MEELKKHILTALKENESKLETDEQVEVFVNYHGAKALMASCFNALVTYQLHKRKFGQSLPYNGLSISEWNGGKVHKIRDNIFHLMRGQVFEIDSKKFFTFGGGVSIDKAMRMPYVSWWPQEETSYEEINEALDNLEKHKNKVDYVITHAAPESIVRNELCQIHTLMKVDCATEKFLNEIYHNLEFKMWFCGHYHMDAWIKSCKMQVLYHQIVKLAPGYPIASRRIFQKEPERLFFIL